MDAPGPRVWPGCDLTGFFLGGNPAFQVVGQLLPMLCEPAFLVEGLSLVGINLHQLSPLRGVSSSQQRESALPPAVLPVGVSLLSPILTGDLKPPSSGN